MVISPFQGILIFLRRQLSQGLISLPLQHFQVFAGQVPPAGFLPHPHQRRMPPALFERVPAQKSPQEVPYPYDAVLFLQTFRIMMRFRKILARRHSVVERPESFRVRKDLRPVGIIGTGIRGRKREPAQIFTGRIVAQSRLRAEPLRNLTVSIGIDIGMHHPYVDKYPEPVLRTGAVYGLHPRILRQLLPYLLQQIFGHMVKIERSNAGTPGKRFHFPAGQTISCRYQGRQRAFDSVCLVVLSVLQAFPAFFHQPGDVPVGPDALHPLPKGHECVSPSAVHVGEQRHRLIFHLNRIFKIKEIYWAFK